MEKKTKLTISGGIAKKSIKNIDKAKTLGKNSVVIEKQSGRFSGKVSTFKSSFSKTKTNSSYNKGNVGKSTFNTKSLSPTSDFERRKLAEQRATKRLKGDNDSKDRKTLKAGTKKRE